MERLLAAVAVRRSQAHDGSYAYRPNATLQMRYWN